jgi:hypothetical protein
MSPVSTMVSTDEPSASSNPEWTRSDGLNNFDLSLLKSFPIRERFRLQFRAEAFNALNSVTFGNPAGNIDAGNFGTVTSLATNTNSRAVQLALKLYF